MYFRVVLVGGLYFHSFHVFFAQFFNFPKIPDFFFPNKYVKFSKPDCFAYYWRISRIVTERLRILIHLYKYFHTSEIMEKNPPIRMNLNHANLVASNDFFCVDLGHGII